MIKNISLLFSTAIFLIFSFNINAQDTYKVTSVWMVNMKTKSQMEITGQENVTFSISQYVIKMKAQGETFRTFRVVKGYTFGWRDYAVPATYDDQEYCKIGLSKYDNCIVIMYPYLNSAMTYYFK